MKRIIAALMAMILLCGLLPAAWAEETVDFQSLAEAGHTPQNHIYIVTQPKFYTSDVMEFMGDYAIYEDIATGRKGIMDYRGNIVFQPGTNDINPIKVLDNNLFLGSKTLNERSGALYNWAGETVLEGNYPSNGIGIYRDMVTGEELGYWIGVRENSDVLPFAPSSVKTVATLDGKTETWEGISAAWNGLVAYRKNLFANSWGLKQLFGEVILQPTYDYMEFVSADRLICLQDGIYRVIDLQGNPVDDQTFDSVSYFYTEGSRLIIVSREGKYGVLGESGLIVPLEYDKLEPTGRVNLPLLGQIGETQYWVSLDEDLTFCGSRNFPQWTEIVAEDQYLIPVDGGWQPVNGENQALGEVIPGEYCGKGPWGGYLFQDPEVELTRIYDLEWRQTAQLPGLYYMMTWTGLCRTCTDQQGNAVAEFYDLNGNLMHTEPNVESIEANREGLTILRKTDGTDVFADGFGNPYPDCEFSFATQFEGGTESLAYRYGCAMNGQSRLYSIIDGRTGKNALGDGVYINEYGLYLPEGRYFPIFSDGKTGVARMTTKGECPFADTKSSAWYAGAVSFCTNASLMNGVGNGKFDPNGKMTRAMMVQVLYNISGEKCPSYGFQDVPKKKWYAKAVNWAAQNGIVKGMSEHLFYPDASVTREQMVTILCRYAETFDAVGVERADLSSFPDGGKISSFARDSMGWAVAAGLIRGNSDGTLNPKGTATRAEIAMVLMRFVDYMAKNNTP